jgi:diguanylate cyclase (GGDEF)-like protein
LLPIFLVTWFGGFWAGSLIAVASAVVWLVADYATGYRYSHPAIPYWNMLVQVTLFLIMAYVLSVLRYALAHERALASTDPLTGVANRRAFIGWIAHEHARAQRYRHSFAIAYLDLDHFKLVNDRFGHAVGDHVLRLAAQTMRDSLRAADTLGRLGGDEFGVLMPEINATQAEAVLRRVQQNLQRTMQAHGYPVTVSIGVAAFATPPATIDELLKTADVLLYLAKTNGKNTIQYAAIVSA